MPPSKGSAKKAKDKAAPFSGAPPCWTKAVFTAMRLSGKGVGGAGGPLPRVALSHGTMRRLRLAVGEEVVLLPEHSAQTGLGAGEAASDDGEAAQTLEATLRRAARSGDLCCALAWPSAAAAAATVCLPDATRVVLGLQGDGAPVVVCRRAAVDSAASVAGPVGDGVISAPAPGLPPAARLTLAPIPGQDQVRGLEGTGRWGHTSRAAACVLRSQLAGRIVCENVRVAVTLHGYPLMLQVAQVDRAARAGTTPSPVARDDSISVAVLGGMAVVTRDTAVTFASATSSQSREEPDGECMQRPGGSGGNAAGADRIGQVLEEVGGCEGAARALVDALRGGLELAHEFQAWGLQPARGVLLYGPPGTGKTLLARSAARALGALMLAVDAPELVGVEYGDSQRRMSELFEAALAAPSAIIFIDEIDVVCGHRESAAGEMERRIVSSLTGHLDALGKRGVRGGLPSRVVVVAATNRPDAIDAALRQPGRFDLEVEVGVPNAEGRRQILDMMLRHVPCRVAKEEVQKVAASMHGCVGADIKLAVNMAVASALHRAHDPEANRGDSGEGDGEWFVEGADLIAAGKKVKPSALRESTVEVPHVRWTDIGGQAEAKAALQEAVEWPLRYPEAFQRLGIRPPAGVLLYGPPGCSKTLLAKALATEAGLNFIAVKGPELFRKYVGDSEKAVAAVFRKARVSAPAVIFFDEIDALAPRRSASGEGSAGQRVVSQLLNEMDGVEPLKQVIVVAATNRPDLLDAAFLRPGRIDRLIYVEPPDLETRKQILSIHLRKMPVGSDVDLDRIARRSEGLSGAELANLCREAGLEALSKDADQIDMQAITSALSKCEPRITPAMLAFYEKFRNDGLKGVTI